MNDLVSYTVLSGWFVTVRVIMPVAGQWLLVSILIIIAMVYQLIIFFIQWYMCGEIGMVRFMRTMCLFILGMLIYVGGHSLVLVYRWEYIGLMSFLLISF